MSQTVTRRPARRADEKARTPPVLRLVYCPTRGVLSDEIFRLFVGDNPLGREAADPDDIANPQDPSLSRRHAVLTLKAARAGSYNLTVRDLDSKNGTYANQSKVEREPSSLQVGDVIRAGDSFFVVAVAQLADASMPSLIGLSAQAAELRDRLQRLAALPSNVLLLGETGTGKEIAAHVLHDYSGRKGKFVDVNCSAVPAAIVESLFFGQVAGAYTDAKTSSGYFREAHRGTLFLDEVGELPLGLQAKLLRALEQRAITPVGASQAEPVDVRIVAATNRELLGEVTAGRFREDLYARLEDEVIRLPPLRTRREDILPLLLHGCGLDKLSSELDADLVDVLLHYDYPRNVRELLKIAAHLATLGADQELWNRLQSAPPSPNKISSKEPERRRAPLMCPSREKLEELLRKHAGVIQYAAEELECSARHLGRWIEEAGIDVAEFRPRRRS